MNPFRDDKYVYVRFPAYLKFWDRVRIIFGGRYTLMFCFAEPDADFKQFYNLSRKAKLAYTVQHPVEHWLQCPACRHRWMKGLPMNHETATEEQAHHRRMTEMEKEKR